MGTARIRQAAGERRSRAAVAAAGLASSLGLWACGGASSGSGALTCRADDSGLAVSVTGAGGAIRTRVCDFDDFGRAVKLTIAFESGAAVACQDLAYDNLGRVIRGTCWTADGASACQIPAGSSPIPFDPTFAWGCRAPSSTPPDFYEACSWSGASSAVAGAPPTASNSAYLAGAELGDSPDEISVLRKTVPVAIAGAIPGIAADTAFAIRRTPFNEITKLIVPVRNEGSAPVCGLSFFGYRWLDAGGAAPPSVMDMYPYASVQGSLARNGAVVDWTCLRPGERGYILETEYGTSAADKPFTELASIALDFSTLALDDAPEPPAGLVPESYDAGTCQGTPAVKVVARNTGGAPVWLATAGIGGWLVTVDPDGLPLGYAALAAPRPEAVLPGAAVELIGSLGAFSPRASRVQVLTDFSLDF